MQRWKFSNILQTIQKHCSKIQFFHLMDSDIIWFHDLYNPRVYCDFNLWALRRKNPQNVRMKRKCSSLVLSPEEYPNYTNIIVGSMGYTYVYHFYVMCLTFFVLFINSYFVYFFGGLMRWPLLCLCRSFMIFKGLSLGVDVRAGSNILYTFYPAACRILIPS